MKNIRSSKYQPVHSMKPFLIRCVTGLAAAMCMLLSGSDAFATLIGDDISAEIVQSPREGIIVRPFTPAMVGAGVEFKARWDTRTFRQQWDIEIDVDASSFHVTMTENTPRTNNIYFGAQLFGIRLSDLDWEGMAGEITDVHSSGPDGVASISHTNDAITIIWDAFPGGAGNLPPNSLSWHFEIEAEYAAIPEQAAIPEPSTYAIFGLGLGALGIAHRRKMCKANK